MKLCRFGDDRLGWVQDGTVRDVTSALDSLPAVRWPLPMADPLWANLDALRLPIEAAAKQAPPQPLATVRLLSPVPRPGKIVAVRRNRAAAPFPDLFLKAGSSIAGQADGIRLPGLERICECEIELAAVIGRTTSRIDPGQALAQLAGVCIALDVALVGEEDRSLRKSPDSFCILGPWVTTCDELPSIANLDIALTINGQMRLTGRMADLYFPLAALIAHASRFFTLHPGDVLLTGSPGAAVNIAGGDRLEATITSLGSMCIPACGD